MAVLKHLSSKNASYQAAYDYLVYAHDEVSGKALKDADGNRVMRADFLIDGVNCSAFSFADECRETNEYYGKNGGRSDVKTHHFIVSFDPRDPATAGLTMGEAHEMCLSFARRSFPGHQAIVCTHPDGDNGSGNIHAHIIINSVRKLGEPVREWMHCRAEWAAGGKVNVTEEMMDTLRRDVMDMCRERGLHQVDLLAKNPGRATERKYWAERRKGVADGGEGLGLVVDLQRYIDEGKSAAYVRKVARSSVKAMAETLAFVRESGFGSAEAMREAEASVKDEAKAALEALRRCEGELSRTNRAISALGRYYANRGAWEGYRATGDRRAYYAANSAGIKACEAARNEIREIFPEGRAPSMADLKGAKAALEAERDMLYEAYSDSRYRLGQLRRAIGNVEEVERSAGRLGEGRATGHRHGSSRE